MYWLGEAEALFHLEKIAVWAVPVNKSGFMQLQSLSAPEIQIAVRKSHNTPTSPDDCLFHLLCIYVLLTLCEKLLKWSRELPWGSLRPYHLVIDKYIYLKQKHKYRRLINVSNTLPSTSVFISILCMNKTLKISHTRIASLQMTAYSSTEIQHYAEHWAFFSTLSPWFPSQTVRWNLTVKGSH